MKVFTNPEETSLKLWLDSSCSGGSVTGLTSAMSTTVEVVEAVDEVVVDVVVDVEVDVVVDEVVVVVVDVVLVVVVHLSRTGQRRAFLISICLLSGQALPPFFDSTSIRFSLNWYCSPHSSGHSDQSE